jgi:hypothetical protein
MKFQATLLETPLKRMSEIQRLFQSTAMDQPIISVSAKWSSSGQFVGSCEPVRAGVLGICGQPPFYEEPVVKPRR